MFQETPPHLFHKNCCPRQTIPFSSIGTSKHPPRTITIKHVGHRTSTGQVTQLAHKLLSLGRRPPAVGIWKMTIGCKACASFCQLPLSTERHKVGLEQTHTSRRASCPETSAWSPPALRAFGVLRILCLLQFHLQVQMCESREAVQG